ncbi:hypothetical protein DDZ13_12840 [Coraliomargarita sinensis]|uniref:histidine kinase n=1 Tax=Coraliomargarita sinensis TaxID=2174842 RepID=A0A317ZGF3_9BACT|nr:ATP-binding protein [Coraliomargarita sinensis]PXA03303.1 hypothetical protein DDZ13_12840 [Coraliomargarita sinensis]
MKTISRTVSAAQIEKYSISKFLVKYKLVVFYCFVGLCILPSLRAWHLIDGSGEVPFTEFEPHEHPGTQLSNQVAEDSRGNIYVCNEAGVLQYDGEAWKMLPATGYVPMAVAIYIDSNNRIWIGGTDHFGYYEAGPTGELHFNDLTDDLNSVLDGDEHGLIWDIFSDNQCHYIITSFQVIVWNGVSWQRHDFKVDRRILPTWLDGQLYLHVRGDGLYRFRGNRKEKILSEHESISSGIITVLSADENELRLATIKNGIWTALNGSLNKELDNPIPEGQALGHIALSEDKTLIAFTEGLFMVDAAGEAIRINEHKIRSANRLFRSSDDSIWVTSMDTIYRIPPSRHTRHGQKADSLERHRDQIYLSNSTRLFTLGQSNESSLAKGWLSNPISRGRYLVYAEGEGLQAVLNGKRHDHASLDRVSSIIYKSFWSPKVFYIMDEPEASRWEVNEDGLVRLSRTENTKNIFVAMAEVDTQTSLYSTNDFEIGLIHWPSKGQSTATPSKEVLTLNSGQDKSYQFVKILQLGKEAVAATDRGFFAFDPKEKNFNRIEALQGYFGRTWSDIVYCPSADREGAVVYINQNNKPSEHHLGILRHKDQSGYTWQPLNLKSLDDLGMIRALLHEKRNEQEFLWIAGTKDLFRYDITELLIPPSLPVNLTTIHETTDDRLYYGGFGSLPSETHWRFPQKSLKISYAAPASALSAKGYQTRLLGFRDKWSPLTESTSHEFNNLYEGDYTFEVRAIDELGRPGPSTAYAFTILPPWYRTHYAYLGYTGLTFAFFLLIARLWTQHLRRRNLELEAIVNQRTGELKLSNQQLREANSVKQNFLASMSHEIRNPLNGILGIAQLLKQEPARDKTRINHLHACAAHLHQLLGQVLDFSSIESGRLEVRPLPFNPGQLIHEVVDMHRVLAESKGLAVKLSIQKTDRLWIGDSVMLRQILINLLSNAIKYTPSGGIHLEMKYEVRNDSLQAKFTVEDSGPGIPEEHADYIFQDFTRLSRPGESEVAGTGLGLPIAKQMAERMNGTICLDSSHSSGARFILDAPFDFGSPIRAEKRLEKSDHGKPLLGKHVLVADDMDFNRYICRELLEKFGARVSEVEDGQLALEALLKERFDLAILDINMPNIDGHQVVRKFLQANIGHPPLFIALTAHVTAEMEHEAFEAGFKHFMEKPLDPDQVMQIVHTQPLHEKKRKASDLLSYLAGNDQDSKFTLQARYQASMRKEIERLRTRIEGKDYPKAEATLHKLRGLANLQRRDDIIDKMNQVSLALSSRTQAESALKLVRELSDLISNH